MPMHYIDPAREADPHALPNVEVWQDVVLVCPRCEAEHPESYALAVSGQPCLSCGEEIAADHWRRDRIDPCWFYWFCFPGCLPDGDPVGPFATEAEALADAQEGNSDPSRDVETFYVTAGTFENVETVRLPGHYPGWYWQPAEPGTGRGPFGPFATEAEALADAREGLED